MKDARLRQPIEDDYAHALGVATFCFAICEWNAVYCAQLIKPGSLQRFVKDELTAGRIAKKLSDLVRNMPKSKDRDELQAAADEFAKLVPLRNCILHGKPCSNEDGKARLSSKKIFEVADLEDAADKFSNCSHELNRLLHGFLDTYQPPST
ncbi:MAG: hypothetical protein P1V20_23915 [Verrucomicrobiales bacterium]|nr:hypothetical protein [Verrucomicrobiales bacterium]